MQRQSITMAFELPGHAILESHGVVRGIVVRSRSVMGSFIGLIRGEPSLARGTSELVQRFPK